MGKGKGEIFSVAVQSIFLFSFSSVAAPPPYSQFLASRESISTGRSVLVWEGRKGRKGEERERKGKGREVI